MNYTSTRNNRLSVSASFAIANGISAEGGLFVPETIPQTDEAFLASLAPLSYTERARKILPLFLTDYTEEELKAYTAAAYGSRFEGPAPAPARTV